MHIALSPRRTAGSPEIFTVGAPLFIIPPICGKKNKELSLSDRTFKCNHCGNIMDRDENASINLLRLNDYTVYE